jgi:hypothetical protein
MIRKRTILSLALLATTAACGGGGGGGAAPAPAASAGGTSSANTPSTNFSSPSAVMAADGTTTMSADQTSQTWTQTGDGSEADPTTLHVHVNAGGVAYDGTYDLTHVSDPTNPFFANNNFQQANGADGSSVVFDVTLSHSAYGLWTGPAGQQAVFAYGEDTPSDQIPKTGTATYTGGAIGTGQTAGAGFNFIGGQTTTISFGPGTATTTISGTVQDGAGNQAPFAIDTPTTQTPGTNKFAGTGASTSPVSPIVPTAQTAQTTFALFGPNGGEMGGVTSFHGGQTSGVIAIGGTAAH